MIQPSFNIAHRETDKVREVNKGKLIELWKTNKKRAIQIVKDGGMKAGAQCPLNAQDIEEYYTEKVKRVLTPPIIYPEWYTSLDLLEPDQDAPSGLITPEEVLKVIKELPNGKSKRVSFLLSVLNSKDTLVRKVARESLALHMCERKVLKAPDGAENQFLGYVVNSEEGR